MKPNKIFKLASGHFLLVPLDTPKEIVPYDLNISINDEPTLYVESLRELARNIEDADKRLKER